MFSYVLVEQKFKTADQYNLTYSDTYMTFELIEFKPQSWMLCDLTLILLLLFRAFSLTKSFTVFMATKLVPPWGQKLLVSMLSPACQCLQRWFLSRIAEIRMPHRIIMKWFHQSKQFSSSWIQPQSPFSKQAAQRRMRDGPKFPFGFQWKRRITRLGDSLESVLDSIKDFEIL